MNTVTKSRLACLGELTLPGAGIGAVAGIFAGFLTIISGLEWGLVAVNALGLAIPMAIFGGGYTILCALGIARVGVFAPAALYWMIAFPVSRIVQEALAGVYLAGAPGLSTDLLSFVLYNALLAPGLAFGFIWMHERLVPGWLMRIRDHNPYAAGLAGAYLRYAGAMYAQKQRTEARRQARRGNTEPTQQKRA
ncbi:MULTISPECIES: hypothetical protein [unclassified Nocardioides]|uniref:hypothetical protein n=1 Tax=unclassified Nocardioides TaxID=2615069 RepID=UPI0036119374